MKIFNNPLALQTEDNQPYAPNKHQFPQRNTIEIQQTRGSYQYPVSDIKPRYTQQSDYRTPRQPSPNQFSDQMQKANNILQDISQFNETQNISQIQKNTQLPFNQISENISHLEKVDLDKLHNDFLNKQTIIVVNDQLFEELNEIKNQVFKLLQKYQKSVKNNPYESKTELKYSLHQEALSIKNNYESVNRKYDQHFPPDISQICPNQSYLNQDRKQHDIQQMRKLIEEFIAQFATPKRRASNQKHQTNEKQDPINYYNKSPSIMSEQRTSTGINDNYETPSESKQIKHQQTLFSDYERTPQYQSEFQSQAPSYEYQPQSQKYVMPVFYQCPICEVNIAESKFQEHMGKCIQSKQNEQFSYYQTQSQQNQVLDSSIYQTQNVDQFLNKLDNKIQQIIQQLEKTASMQQMPFTKGILQQSIQHMQEILKTKDISVTKKILRKIENSVNQLNGNSSGSYNIFMYLKGVQQIVQEKDTFLEQTVILNDLSRVHHNTLQNKPSPPSYAYKNRGTEIQQSPSSRYTYNTNNSRENSHSKQNNSSNSIKHNNSYKEHNSNDSNSRISNQSGSNNKRNPSKIDNLHQQDLQNFEQMIISQPKKLYTEKQQQIDFSQRQQALSQFSNKHMNEPTFKTPVAQYNPPERQQAQMNIHYCQTDYSSNQRELRQSNTNTPYQYRQEQTQEQNQAQNTQKSYQTEMSLKMKFYDLARSRKDSLPEYHPGKKLLISELYEELLKQGLQESQWESYLTSVFSQQ